MGKQEAAAPDGMEAAAPDGMERAAPDGMERAAPDGMETAAPVEEVRLRRLQAGCPHYGGLSSSSHRELFAKVLKHERNAFVGGVL